MAANSWSDRSPWDFMSASFCSLAMVSSPPDWAGTAAACCCAIRSLTALSMAACWAAACFSAFAWSSCACMSAICCWDCWSSYVACWRASLRWLPWLTTALAVPATTAVRAMVPMRPGRPALRKGIGKLLPAVAWLLDVADGVQHVVHDLGGNLDIGDQHAAGVDDGVADRAHPGVLEGDREGR